MNITFGLLSLSLLRNDGLCCTSFTLLVLRVDGEGDGVAACLPRFGGVGDGVLTCRPPLGGGEGLEVREVEGDSLFPFFAGEAGW